MMSAANHPPTCHVCHGSGWQQGPPIEQTDPDGAVLRIYATVEPCAHHWTGDNPNPEPLISRAEWLARHHDRA